VCTGMLASNCGQTLRSTSRRSSFSPSSGSGSALAR
jgi:hypothetical protein